MVSENRSSEVITAQSFSEFFSPERRKERLSYMPLFMAMRIPQDPTETAVKRVIESCPAKAVMSLIGGGVIGGVFGLFTASIDPMSTMTSETPSVKVVLRETKYRMISYSRNFAYVGFLFSGIECCIESYRAKSDLWNGASAGFATGALLGIKAGLRPAMFGGIGFGAFSALIEYYLLHRQPTTE